MGKHERAERFGVGRHGLTRVDGVEVALSCAVDGDLHPD